MASALYRSAGIPAPDMRVKICDLAEDVRAAKRRKLRVSSFAAFEYALDKILLPEVGHLRPSQLGPDRLARLIRDLEARGLAPSSIRRYLTPLSAIFKLAVRRGLVPASPLSVLGDDERPTGGGVRDHYVWSTEEISRLIAAADELGRRKGSQYNYTRSSTYSRSPGSACPRRSRCVGLTWISSRRSCTFAARGAGMGDHRSEDGGG
jgi:integrase